ncbi:metal-sulfur cluster assembly factor [Engelhardtia mirabilis]|uniref:1,2-phenylacetyl-CoA epoxidase, subunit D n=1 Tax=Engelhardtia mirabilis TaxID=2528011 RepID=A0A518BFN0_9BACT|nr:Putative 1,2-phenylacetyl-CoA epoxidase, subunit D [Planctomycetes bacterium Pla133]QDV00113.1 Putative 1,2-phenylacetyl-CoA epoxidase, subunit D [Planctomycetes bacterium Pla86]
MSTTLDAVYDQLRQVFDPEIPVNIVDLGLVYDVAVEGDTCKVTMTLTSQSCPEAKTIPDMVKRRANTVDGVSGTEVEIVWEPQWGPHCITAQGRQILGLPEEDDDDE